MTIALARRLKIGDRDALEAELVAIETALDDIPAPAVEGNEASRLRQGREFVLLPHQVEAFKEMRRPCQIYGEDFSRICLVMDKERGGCT